VPSISTPVLFIVGPTAVGKTRLAVTLGQRFHGEIINADSRQVYRQMDIGTAKPAPEQRRQVPHHLLDIRDPDESFDLGSFLTLARAIIVEICSRGRVPIVVGGTGQYVWALREGWQVPEVAPDPNFRRAKEREAEQKGSLALHRELQGIDPQRARELDPRNLRRVIRALEIYHVTQRRPSDYGKRASTDGEALVVGLTLDREELYRRIDARVDWMVAEGLVEESQRLADLGYRLGWGPLAAPGYREMGQYLAGEITLAEAVQRTKFQTHRLARRQYTWFKANDPRIRWLNAAAPFLEERAADLVGQFLRGRTGVIQ
jgi:tRNA dimethylallyltransferase